MDEHGYPDQDELDNIVNWESDYKSLMDYIEPLWNYSDIVGYWDENMVEDAISNHIEYKISTGGWSGNEDILGAMKNNHLFWMQCWYQSTRGGHYIFKVRGIT